MEDFREYWEDYQSYKLGEQFLQDYERSEENEEKQGNWVFHSWEGYRKAKIQ